MSIDHRLSDTVSRRRFQSQLAAALTAAVAASSVAAQSSQQPANAVDSRHQHDMSAFPPHWAGKEQIALLMYPDFTALDLVGPQYMFAALMGAKVHLVAKTKQPVRSDTGLVFVPDMTLSQCPKELDILFVPGGSTGTLHAMQDRETIAFIQSRGGQAKWVTSVCTGSMLLAAAGLLRGYQATSHWATRDLLPLGGATAVNQRVVVDRNRITGAGVTAGVDMGLLIVEKLRDRLYAQCTQLVAEYAPQPHLNAGTPETAPQLANDMMRSMFTQITADMARTLRSPQHKGNS